jgi:hypothetical protein
MKHLKSLLALFLFFMASTDFAQYGYGYPYGYGGTGGGVDRTIDRQRNAPKTKNKKALEKRDIVDVTVEYLEKKLKLDGFQKAAITNIYKDNKAEILSIGEEDMPTEGKKDKARKISDKIDAQIIPLLSKEQVVIYNEMIAERKY